MPRKSGRIFLRTRGHIISDILIIHAIFGAAFAIVCSIVKGLWGYSRRDLFRDSPLGLFFDKWVMNPIRFFIVFCILDVVFHAIRAYGPTLLANFLNTTGQQ